MDRLRTELMITLRRAVRLFGAHWGGMGLSINATKFSTFVVSLVSTYDLTCGEHIQWTVSNLKGPQGSPRLGQGGGATCKFCTWGC